MTNLTLALDEELLRASRKIAIDRNTTVNQLVREYLEDLVKGAERRRLAQAKLIERMSRGMYRVGQPGWTREDLHER